VPVPDTLRERGAVLLKDPLSDVTRRERRALLGVAAAGYAVTKTGLVPSKIEALGIEFSPKEQGALLAVFAFVVIYFVVTFVLYAATDALALSWSVYIAKDNSGTRSKPSWSRVATTPSRVSWRRSWRSPGSATATSFPPWRSCA